MAYSGPDGKLRSQTGFLVVVPVLIRSLYPAVELPNVDTGPQGLSDNVRRSGGRPHGCEAASIACSGVSRVLPSVSDAYLTKTVLFGVEFGTKFDRRAINFETASGGCDTAQSLGKAEGYV